MQNSHSMDYKYSFTDDTRSSNALWEYKDSYQTLKSISTHFNCSFMQLITHNCTCVEYIHLILINVYLPTKVKARIPVHNPHIQVFTNCQLLFSFHGLTLQYPTFTCVSITVKLVANIAGTRVASK